MIFEEYEEKNLEGLNHEARRLVRMGWNARGTYGYTNETSVTCHDQNQPEIDGLTETTIEVPVQSGDLKTVPAIVHKDCPGLAVTMVPFGAFQVTHISTGRKLCGLYQRASTALLKMSQWALIADMKGKSWTDLDQAGSAQLIEQAADDEVPFDGCTSTSSEGTKKMTVAMWFQHRFAFTWDEFPWEERDPYDMALENFEKIEVAA